MPTNTPSSTQVWDPFVRLFHWGLVTCVVLNLWILEDGEWAHEITGYTASALVVMRLVWGFVGSKHARFSDFFPTPTRLRTHLAALLQGEAPQHPGHNPLGALMMLTLMALVLALVLSGWLQTTDRFWGEEWLQDTHEWLSNGLMLMAGAHGLAAIVMGRLERVHLVRAMVTGRKVRF